MTNSATANSKIEVDQARLFERLDQIAQKQDDFADDFKAFQREIRENYVTKIELDTATRERNEKIRDISDKLRDNMATLTTMGATVDKLNNDMLLRNNSTGHKIGNALASQAVKLIAGGLIIIAILGIMAQIQEEQQAIQSAVNTQTTSITNLTKSKEEK